MAIALLILFFLPWDISAVSPFSGASLTILLISNFTYHFTANSWLIFVLVVGWGFIPIGSLIVLLLSYYRHLQVPLVSILTGVLGIIPFIIVLLMAQDISRDIRNTPLPPLVTPLCLITLIISGIALQRKFTTHPPSSAF